MNYLKPKWVHTLGGKKYAEGWDATFGKKAKKCTECDAEPFENWDRCAECILKRLDDE